MVDAFNFSTQKVEVGGSEIQDRPQLHSELEAVLDYTRLYLKEKK